MRHRDLHAGAADQPVGLDAERSSDDHAGTPVPETTRRRRPVRHRPSSAARRAWSSTCGASVVVPCKATIMPRAPRSTPWAAPIVPVGLLAGDEHLRFACRGLMAGYRPSVVPRRHSRRSINRDMITCERVRTTEDSRWLTITRRDQLAARTRTAMAGVAGDRPRLDDLRQWTQRLAPRRGRCRVRRRARSAPRTAPSAADRAEATQDPAPRRRSTRRLTAGPDSATRLPTSSAGRAAVIDQARKNPAIDVIYAQEIAHQAHDNGVERGS